MHRGLASSMPPTPLLQESDEEPHFSSSGKLSLRNTEQLPYNNVVFRYRAGMSHTKACVHVSITCGSCWKFRFPGPTLLIPDCIGPGWGPGNLDSEGQHEHTASSGSQRLVSGSALFTSELINPQKSIEWGGSPQATSSEWDSETLTGIFQRHQQVAQGREHPVKPEGCSFGEQGATSRGCGLGQKCLTWPQYM